MIDELGRALLLNGFLPHGYCIKWSPPLVATYVISDLLIFLSYFSMPVALVYFSRRRPDFPYPWLLWMFALFILACGATHLMGTVILWQPLYWLDAGLKAVTAVISVATAIVLWPMIPRALQIPSQDQLRRANEELRREIAERCLVEEQLRQANEALIKSNLDLQHFAHVAAHDLQTPLRSIAGFVELLRRDYQGRLDDQADQWLGYVTDNTKRLQKLIQELLAYSRLDAQARPLEETDLEEVCGQVLATLEVPIREAGAEVSCSDLPTLAVDRTQIAQLFQNLIENGIKYNRDQQPRVAISSRREKNEWVFAVADNGIGIAPKHHERIFEIFRRLHAYGEIPGTGIGLAICHRIVERHGGRIWVESQEGSGSTFHFTLPCPGDRQEQEAAALVTPLPETTD